MNRTTLAIATLFSFCVLTLPAEDKQPRLKNSDIPRNEKQLWKRISKSQADIEDNLMSGDPRFTAELDLARRKVADLMLDAEGDKKNKAVVKDLSRCWNYWVRETDEIVTEDLKEYNLATAAGKSFDPADNNPNGGNRYIGPTIQYQPMPAPPAPAPISYVPPPGSVYSGYYNPCMNPDGSYQNGCIPPQGVGPQGYVAAAPRYFTDRNGNTTQILIGLSIHGGKAVKEPKPVKQPRPRPGSQYRGTGVRPAPATHAAVVSRSTSRK